MTKEHFIFDIKTDNKAKEYMRVDILINNHLISFRIISSMTSSWFRDIHHGFKMLKGQTKNIH